ncbi:unnamed protein product [Lactuca virosa]|uniref:Uncharacterized protein n=1 Tax=Lactuca virosa TaxID=75947 RepID=A0AAU9NQF7_9ASTR|nr:unnamed protein product [Lactuca virosa]
MKIEIKRLRITHRVYYRIVAINCDCCVSSTSNERETVLADTTYLFFFVSFLSTFQRATPMTRKRNNQHRRGQVGVPWLIGEKSSNHVSVKQSRSPLPSDGFTVSTTSEWNQHERKMTTTILTPTGLLGSDAEG